MLYAALQPVGCGSSARLFGNLRTTFFRRRELRRLLISQQFLRRVQVLFEFPEQLQFRRVGFKQWARFELRLGAAQCCARIDLGVALVNFRHA